VSYVEILILRHLSARPAHGYELRKRVEATAGYLLHNNSLYPALRRFEQAGAVTKTEQSQEGRPAKYVYELTGTGREMLRELLAELPPEDADDDVEFFTRLGQFDLLEPAERQAVLAARGRALQTRIGHLSVMRELARDDRWAARSVGELLRRAEQELDWLAELGREAELP
jgi:DNA-binding PadR family transcriptional regulator